MLNVKPLLGAALSAALVAAPVIPAHARIQGALRFGWIAEGAHRPDPLLWSNVPRCNDHGDCWGSTWLQTLQEFHETELVPSTGGRSYRLLWFRSFHPAVSVRLDVKPDGTGELTRSVVLNNPSGMTEGPYIWKLSDFHTDILSVPVSREDIARVEDALRLGGFATMVGDQMALRHVESHCLDGAQWLVEAATAKGYRFVLRASCSPGFKRVTTMGRAILDLAISKAPHAELSPIY